MDKMKKLIWLQIILTAFILSSRIVDRSIEIPRLGFVDFEASLSLNMREDPVDTRRKLNVHKTFRRRPGRLLNVLCTFNLRPVSTRAAPIDTVVNCDN